ncbi:hypothetical protein NQZ68_038310 [Dissostichus eleginoides]|nr:hypothetical protein NQZ68_038310 [Dissostichus eleginoides]
MVVVIAGLHSVEHRLNKDSYRITAVGRAEEEGEHNNTNVTNQTLLFTFTVLSLCCLIRQESGSPEQSKPSSHPPNEIYVTHQRACLLHPSPAGSGVPYIELPENLPEGNTIDQSGRSQEA